MTKHWPSCGRSVEKRLEVKRRINELRFLHYPSKELGAGALPPALITGKEDADDAL